MSANSKIEWCDHTFNAWIGCTEVSPACDNCYARALMDTRMHRAKWGAGNPRVRTSAAYWQQPLKWNSMHRNFADQHGHRQRVFCNSLADVFDNEVDPQWRADLFALIRSTPSLDWLLLTKRIGNVNAMCPEGLPWNVWIGATICNQEEANRDIPKLVAIDARVRFLSCEPLLGPIELHRLAAPSCEPKCCGMQRFNSLDGKVYCDLSEQVISNKGKIDWVIGGGESGPKARPLHPDWIRALRRQCQGYEVPFFFKQWGEWEIASVENGHHGSVMSETGERYTWIAKNGKTFNPSAPNDMDCYAMAKVGKRKAGRLIDGRESSQFPTGVA